MGQPIKVCYRCGERAVWTCDNCRRPICEAHGVWWEEASQAECTACLRARAAEFIPVGPMDFEPMD